MKTQTRFALFTILVLAGMLLAACGSLPAGTDVNLNTDGKNATVEFKGVVSSIGADQWVVAGQALTVNSSTVIDPGVAVGDTVQVQGTADSSGAVTATRIERRAADSAATPDFSSTLEPGSGSSSDSVHLELTGKVESIAANSWVVAGVSFAVSPTTEIQGTIAIGDTVKVEAAVNADGTFTATQIKLDTTGASTSTGNLLEFTGKVEAIAADLWTVSGVKFIVNSATEIKGNFTIGDAVKVEALVNPDGTFTAREIKSSLDSGATPDASSTPGTGVDLEFTGVVTAISPTSWTVGGRTFIITKDTEIKGTIVVGDTVKVETFGNISGALTARQIRKADASSGSTPGSGSGDNSSGSSSTDVPSSTAEPTDDHGGGSGKP